jgi:hypothetical protein
MVVGQFSRAKKFNWDYYEDTVKRAGFQEAKPGLT